MSTSLWNVVFPPSASVPSAIVTAPGIVHVPLDVAVPEALFTVNVPDKNVPPLRVIVCAAVPLRVSAAVPPSEYSFIVTFH